MSLCAFSHDAKAGTVNIISQNDADFSTLPLSSFNPIPTSSSPPYSPTTGGPPAVVLPAYGSIVDYERSPFENTSSGPGNPNGNGGNVLTGYDSLAYTSIEANSSATYSFGRQDFSLSLLWGSPDDYNTLSFYEGSTLLASITGAALEIQTYGHDQVTLDVLGPSGSIVDFNSVVLSSGQNAFEFADLQALGAATGSFAGTPLPSTWAMLIAGLVGLGFFGHRGSKKNSAAMAAA